MLTPDFASPEQVRGQPISTASDVYSLGALLYQLLAECPPHRLSRMSPRQMEEAITVEQPARPSTVAPPVDRQRLAGDLDNIVLMALRKEPERRYSSSALFAEDIRRHLDGRPVLARPATLRYRLAKFLGRHAWFVAGVCVIAASLLLGLGAALYEARLARHRYRDVRQLASRTVPAGCASVGQTPGLQPARRLAEPHFTSGATALAFPFRYRSNQYTCHFKLSTRCFGSPLRVRS
jgi:hypothetical protein